MTNYQMVLDWHQRFGVPAPDAPTIPPWQRVDLRMLLIEEESSELFTALEGGNLVAVADAIGDLLYVVYGTAVECGINADAVFAEVHRSNMTKDPSQVREDGKILKGPNFESPNLAPILFPGSGV